jgi:hypothetical protein
MKYIKKFRLFENLESKIDLAELDDILIDFKQMGLDPDIKVGSSVVIDWNLFNDNPGKGKDPDKTGSLKILNSIDIDKYTKSKTNNSLTIEFNTSEKHEYNISETSEAYEMLKDYLFDNYNLIPNYIYIVSEWNYIFSNVPSSGNYSYFEDFDKIKELAVASWQFTYEKPEKPENTFKAHKLVFGFYENPDAS